MTVPLPQSFEMMADLGTVTVCRMDAAIDYAAAVSAADNAALREALRKIADIEDQMYGPDWDEIEQARGISLAALGETT